MRKDQQGMRRTVAGIPRPKSEWLKVEQPLLEDYLDAGVKALVVEYHKSLTEKPIEKDKRRKKGGDRHVESRYLLKNVLYETNTGRGMSGTSSGEAYGGHRRYVVRVPRQPSSKRSAFHSLNASLAETCILNILKSILPDKEFVTRRIASSAKRQLQRIADEPANIAALQIEKSQLGDSLRQYLLLKPASRALMEKDKDCWERRLEEIDRQLNSSSAPKFTEDDVDDIAKSVAEQLSRIELMKSEMPVVQLRRLIETFAPRILYDGLKQLLEVPIVLPPWALTKEKVILKQLGVVPVRTGTYAYHTHSENSMQFCVYIGHFRRFGGGKIFELDPKAYEDRHLPSFVINYCGSARQTIRVRSTQ